MEAACCSDEDFNEQLHHSILFTFSVFRKTLKSILKKNPSQKLLNIDFASSALVLFTKDAQRLNQRRYFHFGGMGAIKRLHTHDVCIEMRPGGARNQANTPETLVLTCQTSEERELLFHVATRAAFGERGGSVPRNLIGGDSKVIVEGPIGVRNGRGQWRNGIGVLISGKLFIFKGEYAVTIRAIEGGGWEQPQLYSVVSLVGGGVIPGSGNTFDVSTETQRIFLKAIDLDEVRGRGQGASSASRVDHSVYKKVWLEGFARAILVRKQGSATGYNTLRDELRSYIMSDKEFSRRRTQLFDDAVLRASVSKASESDGEEGGEEEEHDDEEEEVDDSEVDDKPSDECKANNVSVAVVEGPRISAGARVQRARETTRSGREDHGQQQDNTMTKQQRVNLSPHYFYNFGIYRRAAFAPENSRDGSLPAKELQRGILHIDVSENTVEFVEKEDLQDKMHMNRIATTSTSRMSTASSGSGAENGDGDADNVLTILDTHGNSHRIVFCSSDDLALLLEVIGQIKNNSFSCVVTRPRFVFRKGMVKKVGSSGELRSRFAVLVAKKLFIFIDSTSYFPSNILYLDALSIQYDGNTGVALKSTNHGESNDVNAYCRGRRGMGKTHRFIFESEAIASSWASVMEDAKDYVSSANPDDDVRDAEPGAADAEEGERVEDVFGDEDIFHNLVDDAGQEDFNGDANAGAAAAKEEEEEGREEGFDEQVTKKQAFAFWGVEK